MLRRHSVLVLIVQAFLAPLVSQDMGASLRTWTDSDGRELQATFLYFQEGMVGLRLSSGREAAVSLEVLSEEDQNFVFEQSVADVFEFQPTEVPHQVKVEDEDITVTGGPYVFETQWFQFQFENEKSIARDFVLETALIFEATRQAIQALSIGLAATPPSGLDKFRAQFFTVKNFHSFLVESPQIPTSSGIVGIYDPKSRSIVVPYNHVGESSDCKRMTLHPSLDTSTLIHEITHQVMHDHLPLAPIWFSEGLAEYMASVPYEDGVFDFQRANQGLKARLLERYGSLEFELPPLRSLLERRRNDWSGHTDDYASSLIYTYYFMHLDQPQAIGSPLAAYLFLLDQAKNDTHQLVADYNRAAHDYNVRVVDYNDQVVRYREAAAAYQSAVRDYNLRVDEYNSQLSRRMARNQLIDLGDRPEPPVLPVEPAMPEILKNRGFNSPLDLFQIANNRARPSLLRARDYESIQKEMIAKFEEMGIGIAFGSL